MLEARGVSYASGNHQLLAEVDVAASPGTVTVLIGPNGAGKSTLLRILSGELKPTRGQVLFDGTPLSLFAPAQLACRRAVVPQASALAFPFTALDVVMLGVTVPGFDLGFENARDAAIRTLHSLSMAGLGDRPYSFLSGGERQRVHIARALVQLACAPPSQGNRALLLDEPTSSLDVAHQTDVLAVFVQLARTGVAVIAVLHDINLAVAVADHLVLLSKGRVVTRGRPADVLDDRTLSAVYGCKISVGQVPKGTPFLLPPILLETDANLHK
jgi:iron complex transport system ATP-binding protein